MDNLMVVGIDPGTQGGVAYMHRTASQTKVIKNPTDIGDFLQFMQYLNQISQGEIMVFHEKVNMYAGDMSNPGKALQMQKLFKRVNQKNALLSQAGIPFIEVNPVSWQSALRLRPKREKGESKEKFKKRRKELYKARAASDYGHIKATLWNSDALCILSYGRHYIQNNLKEIESKLKPENRDLFG